MSSGSITAIVARVKCRQCYIAECVCESLSLVSQDFNSNKGMTLYQLEAVKWYAFNLEFLGFVSKDLN